MLVKPSSAFVGKPSVVASSSGRAKKARYARLLPSTRKSSASRTGPSSSCSSAPVRVFGIRPNAIVRRRMPDVEIRPFSDEHLGAAAWLLADRHGRHLAAEPLLAPVVVDAWLRLAVGLPFTDAVRETEPRRARGQ